MRVDVQHRPPTVFGRGGMKPRGVLVSAAGAAVALALFAAHPAASTTDDHVVAGHVLVATGPSMLGDARVEACPLTNVTLEWAARAGGTTAARFQVDPRTVGGHFELRPASPGQLAITFRGSESVTVTGSLAGVSGTVPAGASTATVCLVTGGPTSFVYRATRVSP